MDKDWFESQALCLRCGHEQRLHEGVGSAGHCHGCEETKLGKLDVAWGGRYHNFDGGKGLDWPKDYDMPLCAEVEGEIKLNELAAAILKEHNLPVLFSYRRCFILGYKTALSARKEKEAK